MIWCRNVLSHQFIEWKYVAFMILVGFFMLHILPEKGRLLIMLPITCNQRHPEKVLLSRILGEIEWSSRLFFLL